MLVLEHMYSSSAVLLNLEWTLKVKDVVRAGNKRFLLQVVATDGSDFTTCFHYLPTKPGMGDNRVSDCNYFVIVIEM